MKTDATKNGVVGSIIARGTARFIICSCLLLALCGNVLAVQTDTHGLVAVPAPGPVHIDGKLDDWDLSGATLMCYDVDTLKDVYSATVAMMYDSQNLYVSLHWKDTYPMGNCHDPRYQANKAWAGDCVQLRIKTDRITHVTAWYYAQGKEPAIQIEYGKSLTDPLGGGTKTLLRTDGWKLQEGVEMAFVKDADGKGYVQEIKLPWKLITLEQIPAAGEKFACGVELLWGEADWPVHRYADNLAEGASSREFFWTAFQNWGPVLLSPTGNVKLPEPAWAKVLRQQQPQGPVTINYDLPKDAQVTMAINDANGRRVRNLIAAQPRTKGANVEHWDGLDDDGKPVPAGHYTFAAIYHDGIHLKYAMSYANPGNPTWVTPDGHGGFYADHTAPQAVATAGDGVALACPMGEAGQCVIGCDLTGQRQWGLANRVAFDGGHISLATDGKTLWVASEGKTTSIYRVNLATGQYTPWNHVEKDADGHEFRVLDLQVTNGREPGDGVDLSAIAWHGGELAVCLQQENKIRILDGETAEVRKEISVPSPRSAAYLADGTMIVLSQGKLLHLDAEGKSTAFTAQEFPEGQSIAIDSHGDVLLSVRGADQNVKVFSPDGTLVRQIGKPGGRPLNGPYDAEAMHNPAQIAVDRMDRLWVAEETMNPKRSSVWNVADGKLVKDLAGSTTYAGAGSINPFDPTMAFSDDTVYQIDLTKGTWRPVYSLGSRGDPADIFSNLGASGGGALAGRIDSHTRIVKSGDNTLVYTTNNASLAHDTNCVMLKNGVWREAAHIGVVNRRDGGRYLNPLFDGHDGQIYSWSDKNGDGLVQANELTFANLEIDGKPASLYFYYWGQLPDPKGTVVYLVRGEQALAKFPIVGLTACGAPRYDITHPQIVKLDRPLLWGGNMEGMIMGGSDGRVYVNQDPLITVESNGHVIGGYPNKNTSVHGSHTATAARPGYLIGPSMILGTADMGGQVGEVFDMNGNLGENYLFTADGLWIQSVLKDVRGGFDTPMHAVPGMSMDDTTGGGESFGGNFVRTPDGKVYLTIGCTDARVMEVTGLDTIRRLNGSFDYSNEQFAQARQFVQQQTAQASEPKVYAIEPIATPPVIDGQIVKWPNLLDDAKPAIEIQDDPQHRYGRALLCYDNQNLYIAYAVFSSADHMRNAGQNPQLLFKTGDCVDLMLGPDTTGGRHLRLLMTVANGKPTAVLYEEGIPGTDPAKRVPFSSPSRTMYFDRVSELQNVKFTTNPMPGGYFVEAAVPWTVLGVTPQSGSKLKADLGILFADTGGTTTVARQYWSNKATGLVNDIPGEAELTPQLWGEFILK
jgi:FlgD Ig-like domain